MLRSKICRYKCEMSVVRNCTIWSWQREEYMDIDLWQLAMQHSLVSSQNRIPKFLPCFMVMSCLMICCVHFWCPRHSHWGSPITDCRLWSCELENEHEEKLLIIILDHCDIVTCYRHEVGCHDSSHVFRALMLKTLSGHERGVIIKCVLKTFKLVWVVWSNQN